MVIYKPGAEGYVLYSVGMNRTDDDGADSQAGADLDDIVVTVPPPAGGQTADDRN